MKRLTWRKVSVINQFQNWRVGWQIRCEVVENVAIWITCAGGTVRVEHIRCTQTVVLMQRHNWAHGGFQ